MFLLGHFNTEDILKFVNEWRFSLIQSDFFTSVAKSDSVVIHVYRKEEFTFGDMVAYFDHLFSAEVHTGDVQEV